MNIKKYGIAFTIFVLLFTSCQTLPVPSDSVESVLCLPVVNIVEPGTHYFGDVFLLINEYHSKERVLSVRLPELDTYLLITDLPPGRYYVAGFRFSYDDIREVDPWYFQSGRSDLDFHLAQGELTIPGFFAGQELVKDGIKTIGTPFVQVVDIKTLAVQESVFAELWEQHPEEMSHWIVMME